MKTIRTYQPTEFPTELFLVLTKSIYGNVRPDKTPKESNLSLMTYFLFEDETPIATATVFANVELQLDEKPLWMIGNFEAIQVDCQNLFLAIETDAQSAGIQQLIGPMNGSTWQEHRFIVDQFGSPFLSEMNHPKYYSIIWKSNGFSAFQTYYSYKDTEILDNDERIMKLEDHFSSLNLDVRTIDLSNFEKELESIYELCVLAFRNNVLYSSISKEKFIESYLPFKSWLKKDYIWIAENDHHECLGFLFAFENKLNPYGNELIVKTIAKHPSFRYNGLGTLLGNRFMKKAIENKVESIIHAFMHESNISKNLSVRFNGERTRKYELLLKKLIEN